MGYLNAFCVPHIDTKGTNEVARVDIAKKMLLDAQLEIGMENRIIGFGVDESAGIIYQDGKISIMSLGKRKNGVGEATCHILYVDQRREVMCIPITPNTGEAATLEDLIERAKRSVEALQSPLDLIVREEVSAAVHRRGVSGAIDIGGLGLIEAAVPFSSGAEAKNASEATASLVAEKTLPPPSPKNHRGHHRAPSNLVYSPAPLNLERVAADFAAADDASATPTIRIGELPSLPLVVRSVSAPPPEEGPSSPQRPLSAPIKSIPPAVVPIHLRRVTTEQLPPLFPRDSRDPPAIRVSDQ
jgi:hypothetical protein